MKNKKEQKLLEKVYSKMREDCQDVQMGLGETYFEELVLWINSQNKAGTKHLNS